jgi:CheY-like chemotaxis protein
MDNAAKFTNNGEIELVLGVDEEECDRVKLHIKIRDTGIGIPKNRLDAIFNPFQQADGSTTRRFGGTGLGLSICLQLAHIMDGDVWAESEEGKGSVFHFTAWFRKTREKIVRKYVSESLENKKALIVDDNWTNLKILSLALESVNMRVRALGNGRDTYAILEKACEEGNPFDVCILDIQMPDISGYEVAQMIRTSKKPCADIPLMALSSLMNGDSKKCEHLGFDGFLSKPFQRRKLYNMLERILGGRKEIVLKEGEGKKQIVTQYSIREEMKHSVHILLAEDNPVNQKLAKLMLTKAGYSVKIANDGKEAVDMYVATPEEYDLIFMDIQMPEMDGYKTAKAIREKGFNTIPIVAMTAHAMKGDREKCLNAGMDDYISKPINREQVFTILEKWVFQKETA